MENFKHQTLERLGFVTEYSDQITSKVIQRLKNRKNLRWLPEKTIDEEIRRFYRDKKIRLYWGTPWFVHRVTCQKISAFILKQCAKEHGLELTNVTSENHRQFIVHDYMNPSILFEKHTRKTIKPSGEKSLWQSKQHKAWVKKMSADDCLVPDLTEQFEKTFSDWLEQGKIFRKALGKKPIKSVLYEVNPD